MMMTKKIYSYDRIFVSNQNFSAEHVKNVKNSRFFQVFFKISQIPGFSRLFLIKLSNSRFFHIFQGFQVTVKPTFKVICASFFIKNTTVVDVNQVTTDVRCRLCTNRPSLVLEMSKADK